MGRDRAARGGCSPHTIGLELLARPALSSAKSRAGRLGHTHIDYRYRPRTTEPPFAAGTGGAIPCRGSGKDPEISRVGRSISLVPELHDRGSDRNRSAFVIFA
jgi:hypothetical protein